MILFLIFDEIYSGFCKTGPLFNFYRAKNVVPDILLFSKSFGGGKASIAGYAIQKKFHNKAYDNLYDATLHSTTYFGFAKICLKNSWILDSKKNWILADGRWWPTEMALPPWRSHPAAILRDQ